MYTDRQRLDNGFAWIGELVVVGGTGIAAFIESVSFDLFLHLILSVESPIKEFEYVIILKRTLTFQVSNSHSKCCFSFRSVPTIHQTANYQFQLNMS